MFKLSRRFFVAGAGALVARCAGPSPQPGCQANAWNLDPRFDMLLAALRDMKTLNFEGFETNIRFLQPQLGRLAEASAAIRQTGLVFIGAHTGLPQTADAVARLAEEARQFDARSLVVSHSGLAYHNHQPEFRNNAAEVTGLMLRTDPKLVSFMLDIGHAWLAYPEVISFFEAHHRRVFGLHVRDFHDRRCVPLRQGEFPLHALAVAIKRTGWSGWLINEEERPDEPDKPGIKATGPSRKTMREIFGV